MRFLVVGDGDRPYAMVDASRVFDPNGWIPEDARLEVIGDDPGIPYSLRPVPEHWQPLAA